MECSSPYHLQDRNKHGGIEYEYGSPVLTYEDNIVNISTYIESTEHLFQKTCTSVVLSCKMDAENFKKFLPGFYNGFYSPYYIRFCDYSTYRTNALKSISSLPGFK